MEEGPCRLRRCSLFCTRVHQKRQEKSAKNRGEDTKMHQENLAVASFGSIPSRSRRPRFHSFHWGRHQSRIRKRSSISCVFLLALLFFLFSFTSTKIMSVPSMLMLMC